MFDDMIADMESYSPIFTGLFLRTRKINISLVFILILFQILYQSATHYFSRKFLTKENFNK